MTTRVTIETDDLEQLQRLLNLAGINKELTNEDEYDSSDGGYSPIGSVKEPEVENEPNFDDIIEINPPMFPIHKMEEDMDEEIQRADPGEYEFWVEEGMNEGEPDMDEIYGFWEGAYQEACIGDGEEAHEAAMYDADKKTKHHLMFDHNLPQERAEELLKELHSSGKILEDDDEIDLHFEEPVIDPFDSEEVEVDTEEPFEIEVEEPEIDHELELEEQDVYDYGHRKMGQPNTGGMPGHQDDDNINYSHVFKDAKLPQNVGSARFASNPFTREENDKDVFAEGIDSETLIEKLDENSYRKLDEIATLTNVTESSLFSALHKVRTGMFESINDEEKTSLAAAFINLLENEDVTRLYAVYNVFQSLREKNLIEAYKEFLGEVQLDVSEFIREHGYGPENVYENKRWAFYFGNKVHFFDGFYPDVKKELKEFASRKKFTGTIRLNP